MSVASISTVAGARPVVELGVGDTRTTVGLAQWDVARWDDPAALWAGTEPYWHDITCDTHDVELAVGRDRSIERWQVGSATITVDNTSGWADLAVTPPAPYVLTVRPGRAVRVGMSVDGAAPVWLWRGFIDAAEPRYDPVLQDTVVLSCVDAKGWVGKVDVARADPPVGAGETADARIGRALDLAGWLPAHRDIAPTAVTLAATELGAKTVDVIDVAADSAGGAVFGDPRGFVVFRSQDWQTFDPATPPDATIGNAAPGDVCPSGWELSFDLGDAATRVVVGRSNDAGWTFDDATAQIMYGVETFSRTDLVCDQDSQLDRLGRRYLEVLSVGYLPRVAAVTVDASTSTAARNLAATVDPTGPSRYRCRLVEHDGRLVFDREFFATGVDHRIDPTSWTVRIALDVAEPYGAPFVSRWDQARWDQALWTAPPPLRDEAAAVLAEARALIGAT